MNLRVIWLLLTAAPVFLWAQESEKSITRTPPKTLLEAFQQGRVGGQFRSFFMATDNARNLSDYYALAAGGMLEFRTAPIYHLSLGLSGTYHFNLASSDFSKTDSITGAKNRYEIGLFDVEDPANKNDLDRLDEFWLQYQRGNFKVVLGKQRIQTPFINFQDGRMRPTAVDGIWATAGKAQRLKLEGGWIWLISPRSTVHWYDIGESIGLYPRGLNPDGTVSGYTNNLKSKGVAIVGLTHAWKNQAQVQVWNQLVENIYNTAMMQWDQPIPIVAGHLLRVSLQGIHQNAVNDGGNADASKTYFMPDGQSNVISGQLKWEHNRWYTAAAYTYITGDGRFLSPREWGREPFFTFMARERVEGSGKSRSATLRAGVTGVQKRLKAEVAYGIFRLPDVKNNAYNKYAFPAFNQLNAEVRYNFAGWLQGLQLQLLAVWKTRTGEVYGNEKYVINKVDMGNYNVILHYKF